MVHVSASPPLIPDGRLSRVRLAASDVLVLSQHSLPQRAAAYVHAHIHPSRLRFTTPLAIGSVHPIHQAPVLCGGIRMAITVPRAPSPPWGVTPSRVVYPRPRPALPGPLRSYGRMRQTSALSRPMHGGLVRESLQVAACPCWEEALPDVISSLCVEVLGPVPRRASAVPMPVASRSTSASPYVQEVRRAETPAMLATSMTNQLRGCSHSLMFRLPHLRGPQVAPTAEEQGLQGSRAVYATHRMCGYPPRTVVSLRA
jgi:hypothetical protein